MKNWEKYEEKVREYGVDGIAVSHYGEVMRCYFSSWEDYKDCIECEDCIFEKRNVCDKQVIDWLYQEYKEPRKLTKKQRLFCEMMESGWFAREENGSLYWYRYKPAKLNSVWDSSAAAFRHITITNIVDFPFIKWEDEEPYSIEEMLTWEVEE